MWKYFKYWFKVDVLGIYDSKIAKVLTKPKQESEGWSYKIKIIGERKFFFHIKIKEVFYK